MNKKRIGLDLDSVLAAFEITSLTFNNEKYGMNLQLEDHNDYDLSKVWGCSRQEAMKRVYDFFRSKEFENIEPVKGAIDGVDYLSKKYEMIVITSRPIWLEERTVGWIDTYFPGKFKKIILTNQFSENEKKLTKSGVCLYEEIEVMVEDASHYAMDCADNGIKVFLRDMPWNRNLEERDGITRFWDWSEIRDYL